MSSKLKLAAILLSASFILTGCYNSINNNTVYFIGDKKSDQLTLKYTAPLNTEGINPFQNFTYNSSMPDSSKKLIPISISPDNETLFIMELVDSGDSKVVVKGEPRERVKLIKHNLSTNRQEVIADNIPFITTVRWNNVGDMVGFCGGGELRIFDNVKQKFILQDELKNKETVGFGWSPDSKKVYVEQNTLVNDSIVYIDSEKLVNSYETNEEIYYKAKLDANYYYATVTKHLSGNINTVTVIANEKGEVVKDLPPGRYIDSYKRALLISSERKEGLQFLPDINNPKNIIVLSKNFIYDAKFTASGAIAFTVKNDDIEKNNYLLYIVNFEGILIDSYEVSGPGIVVSPDGKFSCINGPDREKIDMFSYKVETWKSNMSEQQMEIDSVFKTIRGGMRTYYKFKMNEEYDTIGAKNYFVDSNNPDQWAYFDLNTMYNKNLPENVAKTEYMAEIVLLKQHFYSAGGYVRASLVINEYLEPKSKYYNTYALELIKIDSKWYITGMSTFPYSNETVEIRKTIEEYINKAQNGTEFNGELAGKQVKVGQIQFWDMKEAKLSPDITKADGCKVFLRVMENNEEVTYKMILSKGYDNRWKALLLRKDRLNYFN